MNLRLLDTMVSLSRSIPQAVETHLQCSETGSEKFTEWSSKHPKMTSCHTSSTASSGASSTATSFPEPSSPAVAIFYPATSSFTQASSAELASKPSLCKAWTCKLQSSTSKSHRSVQECKPRTQLATSPHLGCHGKRKWRTLTRWSW